MNAIANMAPKNAQWRIATNYWHLGKPAEALASFRKGRQIMAAAVAIAPGFEPAKEHLAWFDEQIAALEREMQTAHQ